MSNKPKLACVCCILTCQKNIPPQYCDCIKGNKGTLEPVSYSIAETPCVSYLKEGKLSDIFFFAWVSLSLCCQTLTCLLDVVQVTSMSYGLSASKHLLDMKTS